MYIRRLKQLGLPSVNISNTYGDINVNYNNASSLATQSSTSKPSVQFNKSNEIGEVENTTEGVGSSKNIAGAASNV